MAEGTSAEQARRRWADIADDSNDSLGELMQGFSHPSGAVTLPGVAATASISSTTVTAAAAATAADGATTVAAAFTATRTTDATAVAASVGSPPKPLMVASSFDSYIETPEWDLAENSQSDLLLQLKGLGGSAPGTTNNANNLGDDSMGLSGSTGAGGNEANANTDAGAAGNFFNGMQQYGAGGPQQTSPPQQGLRSSAPEFTPSASAAAAAGGSMGFAGMVPQPLDQFQQQMLLQQQQQQQHQMQQQQQHFQQRQPQAFAQSNQADRPALSTMPPVPAFSEEQPRMTATPSSESGASYGPVRRRIVGKRPKPDTSTAAKKPRMGGLRDEPSGIMGDWRAQSAAASATSASHAQKAAPSSSSSSAAAASAAGTAPPRPSSSPSASAAAATGPAPSSAPSSAPAEKAPLPEASEEEWERRHAKRRAAVASVKASPEYQGYHSMVAADGGHITVAVPGTPDPMDRTISKRCWEEEVRKWRSALRAAQPADGVQAEPSLE